MGSFSIFFPLEENVNSVGLCVEHVNGMHKVQLLPSSVAAARLPDAHVHIGGVAFPCTAAAQRQKQSLTLPITSCTCGDCFHSRINCTCKDGC